MYIYNLTPDDQFNGPSVTTFPVHEVKYVLVKETYANPEEFIEKVLPKYRGIPILINISIAKRMYEQQIHIPEGQCWIASYPNDKVIVSGYDIAKDIPADCDLGFNLIANPMVARDRLIREFMDTYAPYVSALEINACKLYFHTNLTASNLADLIVSTKDKIAYFKEVLVACKVNI